MTMPNQFYDQDGNKISLDKLCKQEPEWAANQIRWLHNSNEKYIRLLEIISALKSLNITSESLFDSVYCDIQLGLINEAKKHLTFVDKLLKIIS